MKRRKKDGGKRRPVLKCDACSQTFLFKESLRLFRMGRGKKSVHICESCYPDWLETLHETWLAFREEKDV